MTFINALYCNKDLATTNDSRLILSGMFQKVGDSLGIATEIHV